RATLGAGQSVITRDGIWMGSNWVRISREKNAASGVLLRQQELEALGAELEQLSAQLQALENAQSDSEAALKNLENNRESLSREMSERQREYAELRSRVSAGKLEIDKLSAR